MGLYGKTFFISSDFDSILYYNRPVKEYDKRATACLRWNDVLSDVYNLSLIHILPVPGGIRDDEATLRKSPKTTYKWYVQYGY